MSTARPLGKRTAPWAQLVGWGLQKERSSYRGEVETRLGDELRKRTETAHR